MQQRVWQEIELLYQKFRKLGISEAVDYDKYYLYSCLLYTSTDFVTAYTVEGSPNSSKIKDLTLKQMKLQDNVNACLLYTSRCV